MHLSNGNNSYFNDFYLN